MKNILYTLRRSTYVQIRRSNEKAKGRRGRRLLRAEAAGRSCRDGQRLEDHGQARRIG